MNGGRTSEFRYKRHVWWFKCDTEMPQGAYRLNDSCGSAVVFVVADNMSQPVDSPHPNAFLQVRELGCANWIPVGVFGLTEALDRGEDHRNRLGA